ncbi:MAG: hypothetical protein Q4P36_03160 [Bowdeniella nasicola]|nr:hypothetical protein [Bowdeniella nasicola]
MSDWAVTELVFHAVPAALEAALRHARLVARLDYLPTGHNGDVLVTVGVLVDSQGRIAQVDGDRLVAGPLGKDVVQAIATELGVSLWAPSWDVDIQPSTTASERAARSVEAGGSSALVVVTPAPMSAMPMYATAVCRDLSVLDLGDRRVVMSQGDGHAVGFGYFGWDEDSLPALVLINESGERTVALHTEATSLPEAAHSWDLVTRCLTGAPDAGGPAVDRLVQRHFLASDDAQAFADYAGVETSVMTEAIRRPAEEALPEMIALFGLPEEVARVIDGEIAPPEVPGVVTFQHRSLRSAIADSAKLYVGEQFADRDVSSYWTRFEESFARHRRLRSVLAAGEAILGATLVGSAARSGGKVRAVCGALFLADSLTTAFGPEILQRLRESRQSG